MGADDVSLPLPFYAAATLLAEYSPSMTLPANSVPTPIDFWRSISSELQRDLLIVDAYQNRCRLSEQRRVLYSAGTIAAASHHSNFVEVRIGIECTCL